MAIQISGTTDPYGFEVFDTHEQRRVHVRTPGPVSPAPVDDDRFMFPIDTCCTLETTSLLFDHLYFIDIHDAGGQFVRNVDAGERVTFDDSTRFVGLSGPVKLYLRIPGPGTIETGEDVIRIRFSEPTHVELGARSYYEQPIGTITTTDDPASVARAISALSAALKTTTPERTWPSLMSHPPLIERGEDLDIPADIEPAETDLTIEVPASFRELYAVSPLSFYLGAPLEEGDRPRLCSPEGTYELGGDVLLEDHTARLLKQVFFLDCVVRTEGLYPYELAERRAVEDELSFDIEATYDAPLSVRLERYLSVPYEVVEPHIPRWPLTAHVPSTPAGVEMLPFVVKELGIVREPRGEPVDIESIETEVDATASRLGERLRAPVYSTLDSDGPLTLVEPRVTGESIEHAWFGGEAPLGASKATIEAHRSQIERHSRNESIEILVVCNDAQMLEEHDVLDGTYGNREMLSFEVSSAFGVSTADLAELLESGGYDFFHYIGHAKPDGLRCPDGKLDVRSLESVDLGVFFLNACQSYEQGLALARRGAFGGVATLSDIVNEHAVETGAMMARLLNEGFPLRGALEMVSKWTLLGEQYLIVGDGSTDIAQSGTSMPTIPSIDRIGDDRFEYCQITYPTKEFRPGAVSSSTLQRENIKYLSPGRFAEMELDGAVLRDHLLWWTGPIFVDGALHWKADIGEPSFL